MRPAQKEAEAAAIGRSRGGLTTKLHAAVDAIGLPIRIHPTPGHYGDCPQAEALLTGLRGVGHVIADAVYDADPLRTFIADDRLTMDDFGTGHKQSGGPSDAAGARR